MPSLRKTTKTTLKATDYTTILEVNDRGALRGIYWTDPDNATQNETLRITIDGDIVLDGTRDIPNTWEYLNLAKSILSNTPTVTTDEGVISTQKISFHTSLKIEYKRAAAGTTGLSITIVYTNREYFG